MRCVGGVIGLVVWRIRRQEGWLSGGLAVRRGETLTLARLCPCSLALTISDVPSPFLRESPASPSLPTHTTCLLTLLLPHSVPYPFRLAATPDRLAVISMVCCETWQVFTYSL